MKKLLLVPVLLAACADVKQGDEVTVGAPVEDDGAGNNETFETPTLIAGFISEPGACSDNSALIEGHVGYSDGSSNENVVCQLVFEDGSTVDSCFASRTFLKPEKVILIATDTVTLATARYEDTVMGRLSFNASLDVTTEGLSISWNADAIYGTNGGAGRTRISIEPAANVIVDDPAIFDQPTGTVAVTAAGTYTVRVDASIQFADVGSCGATAEQVVDIVDSNPPCVH